MASDEKAWLYAQIDECEQLISHAGINYQRLAAQYLIINFDSVVFLLQTADDGRDMLTLSTATSCSTLGVQRAQLLEIVERVNAKIPLCKAFIDSEQHVIVCTETPMNPAINYINIIFENITHIFVAVFLITIQAKRETHKG